MHTPTHPAPRADRPPVHVIGTVSAEERDCADAMISAVLARHRYAVHEARIRVGGPPRIDGVGSPIGVVQVNLRVCGAAARVQAAGDTIADVIARAAARLHRQLTRLTTAWEPWPWPDPERPSLGMPGAAPIARRKAYRLHRGTSCQAAAYMNAMDYDALLFTDAETGEDAVVYRAGPRGLCLSRQATMHPPATAPALPLTVNPRRTPTLSTQDAVAWLAEYWLPFLFYTDGDTGRGRLLYRRYAGDLGLIAPVAEANPG